MVRPRGLFDTNILIDFLAGHPDARAEVGRFQDLAISIVTWMEVLVGTSEQRSSETKLAMKELQVVPLSPEVVELTILLRRERRLKLPDAMILASAITGNWVLVTRNTRDFQEQEGAVRIPYRV